MLLYLIMPHIRHKHLGPHLGVRLKGRTAYIWPFGRFFADATAMLYAGFEPSFGISIVL